MNISIVNGSPRKNGLTAKVLKTMKACLEVKSDVSVEYFDLSEYDITLCKGCLHCYKTGKCIIENDKIEEISSRIKASDAIIIGSPTYGSSISSYLKALMDRGHFIVEQSLTGKYGFSVATYQIAEGKLALKLIKKFFLVSGASRKGELLLKADFGADPNSIKGLNKKIESKMDKFYNDVKKKSRKSLFEYIFINVIVLPIWKPIFLKNKAMYEGVFRIWREKGIL